MYFIRLLQVQYHSRTKVCVSETGRWVRVLAPESDNLSSNPGPYMVVGDN